MLAVQSGADSVIGAGNPPFHPWRYSTNPQYGRLEHGYMVQRGHIGAPTFGTTADSPGIPWKFRFMFNPSSLNVSYNSPDTSQFPSAFLGTDQSKATVFSSAAPTLTFSLYIDRTYEVNLPGGAQFSHQTGVLVDIDALEKLVGIYGVGRGPMLQIPMHAYFGGVHSFHWLGFISSMSVSYAQFSKDMVPMNAEVDISMTELYEGTSDALDPNAKGSANNPKINGGLAATGDHKPPNQVDGPAPHPTSNSGRTPPPVAKPPTVVVHGVPPRGIFPRGRPNPTPFR